MSTAIVPVAIIVFETLAQQSRLDAPRVVLMYLDACY